MGQRSRQRELIDDSEVKGNDLRLMLDELSVVNRLLGGTAASISALHRNLPQVDRLSLLDVGAGGADHPRAIRRALGRRRIRVEMVASDLSPATCAMARRRGGADRGIPFVACDAFKLPFSDRSFDVVHCALFLHHVADEAIPGFLGELLRVARLGLLVNDLQRHWLAERSIRCLTRLLSRSRFIRHDAPLSVRRAFTRKELEAIASDPGGGRAAVRAHWAFRYTVWIPAVAGSEGS
jgi:2-polyprenyl-3-methyl-5-hydroxy-6-metoxy-1,4-benzoquinol methylase